MAACECSPFSDEVNAGECASVSFNLCNTLEPKTDVTPNSPFLPLATGWMKSKGQNRNAGKRAICSARAYLIGREYGPSWAEADYRRDRVGWVRAIPSLTGAAGGLLRDRRCFIHGISGLVRVKSGFIYGI